VKNICIVFEYDGTNFQGFQSQPLEGIRTIQGVIEKAIESVTGFKTKITGAGRTDAGVSAAQQYANFCTESLIPAKKFKFALNTKLPSEISIYDSFEVPMSFHARYSAIKRTYRYRILNTKTRSALRRNSTFHFHKPLDFEQMEKAWLGLKGKHDFSAFCKSDTDRVNMSCTVFETKCEKSDNELIFLITADTFLRGMVRLLIGTLIEIGIHKKKSEEFLEIIESRDKNRVTYSAGGTGLSLIKIEYPPEVFENKA
jgi:tRNA pseudouridine38-40 synthase